MKMSDFRTPLEKLRTKICLVLLIPRMGGTACSIVCSVPLLLVYGEKVSLMTSPNVQTGNPFMSCKWDQTLIGCKLGGDILEVDVDDNFSF